MSSGDKTKNGKHIETTRALRERGLPKGVEPTALERHCAYFDRDGDGVITPKETYEGCRALGYGRALSAAVAAFVHGALGWETAKPPRPTLNIRLDRVHRGKHGSDTDVYDEDGRFVPERFERLFDRYDRDQDGALDKRELLARCRGDRDAYDPAGQIAAILEFAFTYVLAAEDGKLKKEALRSMYDGTLFYEIEARRAAEAQA